ncbi:helix-turn-helix transcriptional regulator [Candidatus Dojkabacteria bacterium]|uniref:Helix-turn-helix transcriptional regulator n=1 Tax=Candidatus Dojkabacteria bacterium TaxID=2099670 RepID=A0A955RIG8_9BACT|nr:helix-turn-helix transcriptional regulator [Candidatus Dojkabacteria bacterium]
MNITKILGKNLKELRTSRGISQLELERRTGLAAGTISRIEHGNVTPTIVTLSKISRQLELGETDKLKLISF